MRIKYAILLLAMTLSANAAEVTVKTDRLSVTADGASFSIKLVKTGSAFAP